MQHSMTPDSLLCIVLSRSQSGVALTRQASCAACLPCSAALEVAKEDLIPALEPAIRLAMAQQVLNKATEWKGEAVLHGQPFGRLPCPALEATNLCRLPPASFPATSQPAAQCCPCCVALLLHPWGFLSCFWPLIPGVACACSRAQATASVQMLHTAAGSSGSSIWPLDTFLLGSSMCHQPVTRQGLLLLEISSSPSMLHLLGAASGQPLQPC